MKGQGANMYIYKKQKRGGVCHENKQGNKQY